MKFLTIFILSCSLLQGTNSYAEENQSLKQQSLNEVLMLESKEENLDLEKIIAEAPDAAENPKELTEILQGENSNTLEASYGFSQTAILPYSQYLASINGVMCHVGHYPFSTVITPFEGLHYGVQTVFDTHGNLLAVNRAFVAEHSRRGVTFKHYYPDCTVITGRDQITLLN